MTHKNLIPQIVNLNGTGAAQLVGNYRAVVEAIDTLQAALADAAPHGRDYQTQPGTYPAAREAWLQRMQVIALLKLEMMDCALNVQRQSDERRKAS